MEIKSVQLDTSFCIRLLNEEDDLHQNALDYYRYFTDQGIRLKFSTISIAEYCVRGELDDLPLRMLEIIPFNADHAVRAGQLGKVAFEKKGSLNLSNRLIIPNDIKLFSQADIDPNVSHFVSSDQELIKLHQLLKTETDVRFEIINIRQPHHEVFGVLPFPN